MSRKLRSLNMINQHNCKEYDEKEYQQNKPKYFIIIFIEVNAPLAPFSYQRKCPESDLKKKDNNEKDSTIEEKISSVLLSSYTVKLFYNHIALKTRDTNY